MELRPGDAMLARTPLPPAAPWARWPPADPCLASGRVGRARITDVGSADLRRREGRDGR
jgi:hypothetical protein